MELNIKEDSKISPNDLDLEWREQAHLFGLYAKAHAEAINNLAKVRQKLDDEYRSSWDDEKEYGWNDSWGKSSESAIKARIEASDSFIEAEHQVTLLAGCVKTMEHKKVALENLVKLAGMDYFSTPSNPKDLSRTSRFEERATSEEVKSRVHKKLNGIRRKT